MPYYLSINLFNLASEDYNIWLNYFSKSQFVSIFPDRQIDNKETMIDRQIDR